MAAVSAIPAANRRVDEGDDAFVKIAGQCPTISCRTALNLATEGQGVIGTGIPSADALLRGGFPCGSIR